jgi:hypothetical protein
LQRDQSSGAADSLKKQSLHFLIAVPWNAARHPFVFQGIQGSAEIHQWQ